MEPCHDRIAERGHAIAATNGITYTSTHTIISLSAIGVDFALDIFTPVYPAAADYALQSLPYSYLTVNASVNGSRTKRIEVFAGIGHTWTAQQGAASINFTTSGDAGFFWFYNSNQIYYTEDSDQATYGSVLFGSINDDATSNATGSADDLYSTFVESGSLSSLSSASNSGTELVAIVRDLGAVRTPASVTFAVGFQRDLAIQYLGQAQTGYHRTKWPTIPEAIEYFLGNYDSAFSYSTTLDELIRSKSESVSSDLGSDYADINEASVRQSFASLELTVPNDDRTGNISAFLKEISSDGNVNTIDLIFQSWPIFISLNPEWISYNSGQFYHTLPLAAGLRSTLYTTLALIILMLPATMMQFSGDSSFAAEYSSLFKSWAQYLAANGPYPESQLISVDAIAESANQTGLAIQSAIGLKAGSVLTGNNTYSNIADSFATTLYENALGLNAATVDSSTHFTYNYSDTDTWNVLFPAYSDVILNLTTFPQAAWNLQSTYYSEVIQDYGLAFAVPVSDRDVTWGITDWNIEWAAIATDDLKKQLVQTTHKFLTNGLNVIPFGTKYYVEGDDAGVWIGNKARGSVGTHFAIVALEQGTWEYAAANS